MAIVKRIEKGSPITHIEMDNNLTELENSIIDSDDNLNLIEARVTSTENNIETLETRADVTDNTISGKVSKAGDVINGILSITNGSLSINPDGTGNGGVITISNVTNTLQSVIYMNPSNEFVIANTNSGQIKIKSNGRIASNAPAIAYDDLVRKGENDIEITSKVSKTGDMITGSLSLQNGSFNIYPDGSGNGGTILIRNATGTKWSYINMNASNELVIAHTDAGSIKIKSNGRIASNAPALDPEDLVRKGEMDASGTKEKAIFSAYGSTKTADIKNNVTIVGFEHNIYSNYWKYDIQFSGIPAFINSPNNFVFVGSGKYGGYGEVSAITSNTLRVFSYYNSNIWDVSPNDISGTLYM